MDGKQLKNSILQWAIQGKLVPQNPKDEPAQKLLERIAAARNEYCAVSACHPERSAKGTKSKDLKKKTSKNQPSRIYRENGVWYEQVGTATPKDISDEIPFEIPESWAWCRLKNICSKFSTGPFGTMLHKEDYVENNGIPLVNPTNIKNGKISSSGIKCVNVNKYKELSSYVLTEGDLVIARRGDLSKCAIVGKEENAWLAGTGAFFLRPEKIDLAFFVKFYTSPYTQSFLTSDSVGSTMDNLNQSLLGDLLTPLPPLAEQKRIVAKLEQVLPLAEEYGAAQEQLDKLNKELPEALKKSILQEAIQGKLVPQNPKDEPAQKLLERIAASRNESSLSLPKGTSSTSLRGAKATKQSKNPPSHIYRENGTWYEQIGNAESKDISDEIPFDIPENWTWVRFENVAHRITGKTPERGNSAYWLKGTYPWITISDMSDYGHVASTKECITEAATNLMGEISPKDSLLMSFKLTVGRTSILDIDAYHNEAIITVKPYFDKENIFRNYLFTFLPLISMTGSSKDAIKGMTLNAKSIAALLIPLPPLAEQKRIVAKLEQLFKVL